nr:F-box domain, leucine-rich repeat domain, L domain-like protein [Tanacetum cinerariifolium]
INAGIQKHLQKAYNANKAAFKAQHWVIDPTTGTYNAEKIRRERPENITASEWDKYIEFCNDPRNIARAAQNRQNWAKGTVISRQGSRLLARLRDEMEEMRRLEAMGTYTDDEINHLARGGKQRGHIVGVGRVLLARDTASPSTPAHDNTLNSLHKKVDFMMTVFKSDSKYLDMFLQFESGGASESGRCEDEEEGADHQDDEDEDSDGEVPNHQPDVCFPVDRDQSVSVQLSLGFSVSGGTSSITHQSSLPMMKGLSPSKHMELVNAARSFSLYLSAEDDDSFIKSWSSEKSSSEINKRLMVPQDIYPIYKDVLAAKVNGPMKKRKKSPKRIEFG